MNPTVQLTPVEIAALRQLARQTGKTKEQLVHEAVAQLLQQTAPGTRQQAVEAAQGIWRDRTDLPDFARLRAEGNRNSPR